MSDAHRDPAVLVSSRIRSNAKILALPIEARWAFVVMLGEAKLHRPPGQFENRSVLDYRMAELAPQVEAILGAHLAHVAPYRCGDCRAEFGPVKAGTILVHNWHSFQGRTSTERVQRHRGRLRSLDGRSADGSPSEHELKRLHGVAPSVSETGPETPFPPRALQSQSIGVSSSSWRTARDGDEPDPLDAVAVWLAEHRMGAAPGSSTYTTLARLADQHGSERVIATFEELLAAHPDMRDAPQFVFGARKSLNPIPDVHGPSRPAAKGRTGSEDLQGAVERV